MKLQTISDQGGQPIREFYQGTHWAPHWEPVLDKFRALVDYLENSVDHPPVWAFTSHENLLLTDVDDYRSWRVKILIEFRYHGSINTAGYHIEYPLPTPSWRGYTYTFDTTKAAQLILDAWQACGNSKQVPFGP